MVCVEPLPCIPVNNEQTYQSTVIWLRIKNRQVTHIQTMAIGQSADKVRYNRLSKIWLRAGNSPRQIIKGNS